MLMFFFFEFLVTEVSAQGLSVVNLPLQKTEGWFTRCHGFVALLASCRAADSCIIQTDGELLIQPGTEVDVTTHFDTPPDLHDALRRYWEKRWWKDGPSTADWTRIFAFAQAHLPHGSCSHELIDPAAWADVNKRYTKKAARGADGFSAKDLQLMPPALQSLLVDQLNDWEATSIWPEALLTGFVYPLPKKDDSCKVGDFRPVIIYSTLYRSWSSLRARTFIRYLAQFTDAYQLGFMPGCEATQVWLLLQAIIECAHQTATPKVGFVCDIVKAFESLPRDEVFGICKWLGLPRAVLALWFSFLSNMTRRFKLGDVIGEPIRSNLGFPEGCALSCAAMAAVDICFHSYLRVFAPSAIPLSFVDNLELVEGQVSKLASATVCIQTWAQMWGLQLDDAKTYTWATTAELRQELQALGWSVRENAKDLGAQITYGKKKSVKEQQSRLDSLDRYWMLLNRTVAPEFQKCQVIFQAFWPRAFHGVANCTLGWSHIKSLRTSAMRALRYNRAGANPAIRLGLLTSSMNTDPGFYQFWSVIVTFRRMLTKQPSLETLWARFMNRWTGSSSHGPFGKMIELTSQVGWSIHAPCLVDHDGIYWHLPTCDETALRRTATDAWAQKIAHEASLRKDFDGLKGLDYQLLRKAINKLPQHQQAWLHVLRDGSFVNPSQHKKYDVTKITTCPLCHQEDSVAHRVRGCSMLESVYAEFPQLAEERDLLPSAFYERLLPSRNPWHGPLRSRLARMNDLLEWHAPPPRAGDLHLFTDGSCSSPDWPEASLASFACISAGADELVFRGICGGSIQSSDLAELKAVRYAIQWSEASSGNVVIWTDSAYVATGVNRLLADVNDVPEGAYYDEWICIQQLVGSRIDSIQIHHVAAHLSATNDFQTVTEWSTYWNDRVDHEAKLAARLWDAEVQALQASFLSHATKTLSSLCQLQNLHLAVHERRQHLISQNALVEPDMVEPQDDLEDRDMLGSRFCHVEWQDEFDTFLWSSDIGIRLTAKFGTSFSRKMVTWLVDQRRADDMVTLHYSFVELAAHWILFHGDDLPVPDPQRKNHWHLSRSSRLVGRVLTLAAVVRIMHHFFGALAPFCPQRTRGISLPEHGISMPLQGISMSVSRQSAQDVLFHLRSFTARRPIRSTNDLARPLQ